MTAHKYRNIDWLHEPMPSHPRAVTWRDVVASALWTIGGAAFVAALLKIGGGW